MPWTLHEAISHLPQSNDEHINNRDGDIAPINSAQEKGPGGGGHSTFFQVGVCGPDFQSVGLANGHCLWKGGLVSGKFPNLEACELKISKFEACELKISKFGGLWAKIWVKIEAVEAKISKFSQKGSCETDSFAWNGTLASGRRGAKRGSSGPHIPHTPFLGQCPPGEKGVCFQFSNTASQLNSNPPDKMAV